MVRLRIHSEVGAVTVIVALFITVLFAFVALSVDVARLYEERRALSSAADLSALSGAQLLWKSESDSEALGQQYITYNPTINHPGAYSAAGGDVVDAKRLSDGSTGCPVTVSGVSKNFDCIVSTVRSPSFKWLFGSVLGLPSRSVSFTSTALIGGGAVSGTQVFPWLLRDCPNSAQYPDEGAVTVSQCPYQFSDIFNGPKTSFDESLANYVGAVMPHTRSGCPVTSGFKSGVPNDVNTFSSVMNGSSGFEPCLVAPGQRIETRDLGGGGGQDRTQDALTARGANATSCMNETSFNATFTKEGDGDGFVGISNPNNPCLIVVSFVVYASDNATTKSDTAMTVSAAQKSVAAGRFDSMGNNKFMVIRRMAYYYITSYSNSKPQGVYLRAVNPKATMTGPLDKCPSNVAVTLCAHNGIFVVKLF